MKIDYDLIFSDGHGRPVPTKMDSHIIKYVIEGRIEAVANNPDLLISERWDHSDVFYAARTHLSQHNWDVSVYNDNENDEGKRRKAFYDKIKDICEGFFGKKRHEIGIFPKDRANMTFKGQDFTINYHSLPNLMGNGTDVVFVEKQGTVIKMSPFAEKVGLAFIDSEGFGSEYGVALARLCDKQAEAALTYTKDVNGQVWIPPNRGHLANLTDCDVSGIGIGIKINRACRIGIDLHTIQEINNINPGLAIEIEDVQEGIKLNPKNTHWKALIGLLHNKGKLYDSLIPSQREYYKEYLTEIHVINDEEIRFIDWLQHNRIELNSVLAAAKPIAFWNWLKWKLNEVWSDRDYNRAISLTGRYYRTPTMDDFVEWYDKLAESVVAPRIKQKEKELSHIQGFVEDIESEKEDIETDIIDNTLLTDEQIQKLDLALKALMAQ